MAIRGEKVTLNGVKLWAMKLSPDDTNYSLAPPEHCDAQGRLRFDSALLGTSYAHVFGFVIKRHHAVIGYTKDLVSGWTES